jgi:hypothetical protein
VYPEYVSSTIENEADSNDPKTRWFIGSDYASCQHRSYACSLRQGRRNVQGNISTLPATKSDVEIEDTRNSK